MKPGMVSTPYGTMPIEMFNKIRSRAMELQKQGQPGKLLAPEDKG